MIKTARNKLRHHLQREPSIQEIANDTGFTPEEIAAAEIATSDIESINQNFGESDFSLENILESDESEEKLMERVVLNHAIDQLTEREALVIRMRYYHGLTQQRVSVVLKVSQVQISRIEKKALLRLRELME